MIKDVDGLSRHIDIRIHHYLTQSSRMCLADLALRPFSYSFDWFNSCSNPCRITTSAITITTVHLQPFPQFPLFIILQFCLLSNLLFNHIPFQNLFHIPFIIFPLRGQYMAIFWLNYHLFKFTPFSLVGRNCYWLQVWKKSVKSSYCFFFLHIYSPTIYNTTTSIPSF